MDYLLVPITEGRAMALSNCNEDNCDDCCPCYLEDDCLGNYHKLSEIKEKMQSAIKEYIRLASVKITGEYYPNMDRMQVMEYANGIIDEVLNSDGM